MTNPQFRGAQLFGCLCALNSLWAFSSTGLAAEQQSSEPIVAATSDLRSLFSKGALRDIFGSENAKFDFAKIQEEAEVGVRFFDIYVNGDFLIHQRVELFRRPDGNIGIRIPAQVLFIQPLRFGELPKLSRMMPMDYTDSVDELIPGASVHFDSLAGRVDVDIPRSWYASFGIHSDVVPSQRWTYGIPALAVNYHANADIRRYDSSTARHGYLDFDGQFNWNEWRIFANGSVSYDDDEEGSETEFDRGSFYATRVFGESQTRIRIGEIYTQSYYMDAIPIIGLELHDDESMMSTAERAYTPVVSGIAQTAARVTVRQMGRIVFERNVPAGPFSFDDLPGLTAGSDLEVTITEQSGQERTFLVPYVTNPFLLRAGRIHFTAAIGRWRDNVYDRGTDDHPFVFSGGIGYGLPFDMSVFAGTQLSDDYTGATAGVAVNLGAPGSVSFQLDHSDYHSAFSNNDGKGTRFRFLWSNRFRTLGSYVSASWRRYVSGEYMTLSDTMLRTTSDQWIYSNYNGSLRDEASLTLTQPLGKMGSLSVSGSLYRYEDDRSRQNISTTYTKNWKGVTFSLSMQHYRNESNFYEDRETIFYGTVNIPLSLFAGYKAAAHYVNLGVRRDDEGNFETTEGVSGTFGENNRWSYSLSAGQNDGDQSYYGSLSHEAEYGRFSVSASHDELTTAFAGSMEGSIIATSDGVFPARTLSGASALLEIPDAPEARPNQFTVSSRVGDRVLITGLSNYRVNEVAINPNTVPPNVTMPVYVKRLVPADDAILVVPFETMRGWQFVPELQFADGTRLPYGTAVRVIDGGLLSGMDTVLNERARAYFPSAPVEGTIEAVWEEEGTRKTCWAPFSLAEDIKTQKNNRAIRQVLICREPATEKTEVVHAD